MILSLFNARESKDDATNEADGDTSQIQDVDRVIENDNAEDRGGNLVEGPNH